MDEFTVQESTEVASLIANALDRLGMARALGQTAYGGDRDYYEVLGYNTSLGIDDYLQRYERQDIAHRIVDLPAIDTWKKPPKVSEEDDTETEFVEQWEALNKRLGVFNILSRADRLSGIGRYGVILLGLRDSGELSGSMTNKLSGEEDVLFLRAFSEHRVKIDTWDKEETSPRFGMPLTYEIELMERDKTPVHYTRIIHLADDKLDSEIFGTPRLRTVFNLLDDLMKIVGGTAEATWLNMRPGIMVSPEEGYDWKDTTANRTAFLEEMRRYAHDPLRMLRLVGMEAKQIGTAEVMDPSSPFNVTISLVAAATGIPQRILTGAAKGELSASQEDTRQWAQFINNRQKNYAEPEILRVFIDKLITLGALSVPRDGVDSYDIGTLDPDGGRSWPSLIELSELERAEAIGKQSTAVKNLSDPITQELPISKEESRELLGYPPEEPVLSSNSGEELVLQMAIQNYRDGLIEPDDLAQFAIAQIADNGYEY